MTLYIYQKRTYVITLNELTKVFFSSSAIVGGLKLMYATFILLDDQHIESDKLYTFYGGFCVFYVSMKSLYERIKAT